MLVVLYNLNFDEIGCQSLFPGFCPFAPYVFVAHTLDIVSGYGPGDIVCNSLRHWEDRVEICVELFHLFEFELPMVLRVK